MCTHCRSSRLGRLYLFRQRVPTCRNWGGVQFLTRSHRTALSEQTGPVPRVITTPLYILDTRSRLITSGDAPGGLCDDGSFVCYGEFCQTPMVTPGGFEPTEYRRERPVTSAACRWCHISLFLRPHLFLSGLSPQSHIPHIQYLDRILGAIVRVGGS